MTATPSHGTPLDAALTLRPAVEDDVPIVLTFIRELADHERLLHEVVADEATLRRTLFGLRRYAEVVLAELDGEAVGFALFFHNFSTFLGRPGIYLEDLYVRPSARGQGIGRALLGHLARLVLDCGGGRLEWNVLDWNEASIRFYRGLGARSMEGWNVFRLAGAELERLAAEPRRSGSAPATTL
jgi:GNAT superfamily N-acetyltransferase